MSTLWSGGSQGCGDGVRYGMRAIFALLLLIGPARAADTAQETILANKSRIFTDPNSIQDASIGPAFPCGKGACVCLEFNARNTMGGMNGMQMLVFQVADAGRVIPLGKVQDPEPCGKMAPFPALNGR